MEEFGVEKEASTAAKEDPVMGDAGDPEEEVCSITSQTLGLGLGARRCHEKEVCDAPLNFKQKILENLRKA